MRDTQRGLHEHHSSSCMNQKTQICFDYNITHYNAADHLQSFFEVWGRIKIDLHSRKEKERKRKKKWEQTGEH